MIFTHLTITNFGVYRGVNEFELRPQVRDGETRPVILFGGKNGAGKTTILQAVRLCLYGRLALGMRVRAADYESYIIQHMHRGSPEHMPACSAQIGLVFEHTHAGVQNVYNAVRSWQFMGQDLEENISIYKDGHRLEDIPPDHWNDFLRDLIPPGIADLFFFDGEQIQALADDETEIDALSSAIGNLFNLDLIERLQADLNIYLKQQENNGRSMLQTRFIEAQEALEVSGERLANLRQDKAQLNARIAGVAKRLEDVRQTLLEQGAGLIRERAELEKRQAEIEALLEQYNGRIRELAGGLLPFAVAPVWGRRVVERLKLENRVEQSWLQYAAQQQYFDRITEYLQSEQLRARVGLHVTPSEWEIITREIRLAIQPNGRPNEIEVRHPVSPVERDNIYRWVGQAVEEIPGELHRLANQIEQLETERHALEKALSQIPEEVTAAPLLDEFFKLSQQKGRLEQQFEQLGRILYEEEVKYADLERQLRLARQKLAEADDLDQCVERAVKVQMVLDRYLEEISALKLAELEQAVGQYFNLLCRKQKLVREVRIDPKTYRVTLYGDNREVLPQSELSAGEKQLYAMALLWALRSVSGRALPIIIDTPMGRLDSEHREKLLRRFFPHAAHQIILLSTDTEIDAATYKTIEPIVSHTFHLEYDQLEGYTRVEREYFSPNGVH